MLSYTLNAWNIQKNIETRFSNFKFKFLITTYHFRLNEINSVIVSRRVVTNVSSGRKVFKLLKFVDEIKAIINLLRQKKKGGKNHFLIRYLSVFAKVCSFFYYILDNVVWIASMGAIK